MDGELATTRVAQRALRSDGKRRDPAQRSTESVSFAGRAWLTVGLALLVVLPYLPTLWNGFVWDDVLHITDNPLVASWSGVSEYFPRLEGRYYRPLVFVSFWMDRGVWGPVPVGFHLTNLALHLLNTLLLMKLGIRTGLSSKAAAFGAAVFALHPIQVDAVAYISGRTDLLMTAGALLAWRALIGRGGSIKRGLLAGLASALAVSSKESGYALMFFLPWVAWRQAATSRLQRALTVVPALAVMMVLLILRPGNIPWPQQTLDPVVNAAAVGRTLVTYVELLVWPAGLRIDRLTPVPVSDLAVAVSIVVLAACVALALWGLTRRGAVASWTAWSVAFYAPAANLLVLYPAVGQRILFTPEHNLYAPMAGLAVLIGIAFDRVQARLAHRRRVLVAAVAVLVLLSWGLRSGWHTYDWRDEETIFTRAAAAGSRSPRVWLNLGNTLMRRGATAEAVSVLERAVQLAPRDAPIWMNLGVARQKEGRFDSALLAYRRAAALQPDNAQLFENLGTLHIARGEMQAARQAFAQALSLDPRRSTSRQALQSIDALRH